MNDQGIKVEIYIPFERGMIDHESVATVIYIGGGRLSTFQMNDQLRSLHDIKWRFNEKR